MCYFPTAGQLYLQDFDSSDVRGKLGLLAGGLALARVSIHTFNYASFTLNLNFGSYYNTFQYDFGKITKSTNITNHRIHKNQNGGLLPTHTAKTQKKQNNTQPINKN